MAAMRALQHPSLHDVGLPAVLAALADDVRLTVVGQLARGGPLVCGQFDTPVALSTLSHHLKVLRAVGILRVTPEGRYRRYELRAQEMEQRFPGLLDTVIRLVDDPFATSATA